MRRTNSFFLALLISLSMLSSAASLAAADTMANTLPAVLDQYGQTVTLNAGPPAVRVAIVVSAKRLRRIKKWEQALRSRFPDLPVIRIADVPQSAPTDYENVAEKLRKRLPEDLSVGIDLDSAWAKILELDTSVPNILVFDSQGRLDASHSGMFSDELFPAVAADIDLLMSAEARR